MHITLCATNCSYVILWSHVQRRSSVKNLSCNKFKQKKRLMYVIHMLKLLVHFFQYIALFFKAIDYVLCVMRHARSDKTDKIVRY